ncbi:uncharacterized protein F35H12.5-like [Saccoglossus kowalevskii]|uniref:Uncharacterized protein LOC100371361 n=1 Tax=Saccoglossus kowalevskii TaxID=10224 RepID=A0ABM0GPN2_SACKO|nr:PREDICTED: uncharacterized protein LOC100371361 [Saccoglossus kowalevskii]
MIRKFHYVHLPSKTYVIPCFQAFSKRAIIISNNSSTFSSCQNPSAALSASSLYRRHNTVLVTQMRHVVLKRRHPIVRCYCSREVADFELKVTTVESCGDVFDVSYVDIGKRDAPIIVCLHGSPASHKDFALITPYLLAANARVILPNFPGYGYCKTVRGDSYYFTSEHKAEFIKDFLQTINVNRVTVLVCHSASGTAASQLCAHSNITDSVVFMSGIGIWPHRAVRSLRLMKTVSALMNAAIIGDAMQKVIPWMSIKMSGFRVSKPSYMIALIHEMARVDWLKSRQNLEILGGKSLPIMIIGVEDDPIVQSAIAREGMRIVKVDKDDDVLHFDQYGNCVNENKEDHRKKPRRGIIFEKGGHWIQNSYPELISDAILDLMQLVAHNSR